MNLSVPMHARRHVTASLISGLILAFLFVDLMTPTVFETQNEYVAVVFVGLCTAQLNLIAAWAALAPGNILLRVPWSMLLGVLMWYALIIGIRVQDNGSLGGTVILGISLLVGLATAQIPLWIASKAFHWRLMLDGGTANTQVPHQYHLRHLLLGMLLLSIVLGMARFILPEGDLGQELHMDEVIPVLLMALIISNLFITVPCIWGSFLPIKTIFPLVIGWGFYCIVLTGLEVGTLCLMLGTPGDELRMYFAFCLLNGIQCLTVLLSFLVLRLGGFRFIRLPDKAMPNTAPSDATDF